MFLMLAAVERELALRRSQLCHPRHLPMLGILDSILPIRGTALVEPGGTAISGSTKPQPTSASASLKPSSAT